MSDPIIPGISDERAREIAQMLQSHKRLDRWGFLTGPVGYDEWFLLQRAKLINWNGYSTPAGRALWERIKDNG